jgi:hypothetical protein
MIFKNITQNPHMHLTRITSAKSVGFEASSLYPKKERSFQTLHYFKQRSSFLVASLSLIAFITGNLMGEHGWYAFLHSFAKYDDSLIVYTGTVPPVAFVPDYQRWSLYGGDAGAHTYRQVPQDVLIPLPNYDSAKQRSSQSYLANLFFSVGDRGSYATGAENGGSHPGIDIRLPIGTPVRAVANGIVESVKEDRGGYGFYIVIRHPNAPDPKNPKQATVLHSVYAHLSAQLVAEGDIVNKGQEIALSGQTGFATGPHLHFQMDTDDAPYHPYWPFTTQEAREAGLTFTQAIDAGLHQERLALYTVNPMLYVQANYAAPTVVAGSAASARIAMADASSSAKPTPRSLRARANDVRAQRIARRGSLTATAKASSASSAKILAVVSQKLVSINDDVSPPSVFSSSSAASAAHNPVKSLRFQTPVSFSGRGWIAILVRTVDENGAVTDASTLAKPITLRTAIGDAEFSPAVLKASDFVNGVAKVQMLPLDNRTVVINAQPMNVQSDPIAFKK